MNDIQIDLTSLSYTFPIDGHSPEILADSKIREIQNRFSNENTRIIVVGPSGAGKTTLLKQFAQKNKNCTFSYFFTDNFWNLRPTMFLSSICRQMAEFLGLSNSFKTETKIDIDKQKQIFDSLCLQVMNRIYNTGNPCYFVIDGLEHVLTEKGDQKLIEIIALLTNPKGLYYLGSVNPTSKSDIPFNFTQDEPNSFSLIETSKYLEAIKISEKDVERIQEWAGGMPGMLMLARKMVVENNITVEEIVNGSKVLEQLIEKRWVAKTAEMDEFEKSVFAILAFSIIPLSTCEIASILDVDINKVRQLLISSEIIKKNSDGSFEFYLDSYKKYAKEKFSKVKKECISKIIKYYQETKNDEKGKILIPRYFGIAEDYEALKNLLTPEYLLELALESRDISLVQRDLHESIDLGKRNQDLDIIKFCLADSQLNEINIEMIGFSEVLALIALKKIDDALECAYSSPIITTKIRILARVYNAMEKEGITVSRKAIDELENLVDELDSDSSSTEMIINIAADLFPILPDLATQLVDKKKGNENAKSPQELFVLMTSTETEGPGFDSLLSKISNEKIHDFAISHSPWLSKLSAEEIISKTEALQNTKAKEYMLRRWCLENRQNKNLTLVINKALDVISEDSSYHVSLKHLRQLSSVVKFGETGKIHSLVQRFEIPLFFSIQSPIEERIRLKLNLVEAIARIDIYESQKRLNSIQKEIFDCAFDSDVKCRCLASFLVTLSRIDVENKNEIQRVTKEILQDEYLLLMKNSASQLDVSKSILRSVALVDIQLALTFAGLLNLSERRDLGIQEVLISFLFSDDLSDFDSVMHSGLSQIIDNRIREKTVLRIVDSLSKIKTINIDEILDCLCEIIGKVNDPVTKAKCYSAVLLNHPAISNAQKIFEELLITWRDIDIAWMRIECGYEVVDRIGDYYPDGAEQLFLLTKDYSETTSLSNETLGYLYFETIRKAAKFYGKLGNSVDVQNQKGVFLELLDRIPSNMLRILALGTLSLSLIRNGYKKDADQIIQEKIIPGLQNCGDSQLKDSVISDIAIVLFEYSPEEAKKWVGTLPYSLRSNTWVKIIIRLLTQSYITDQYDADSQITGLNIQVSNQVLNIISNIDKDFDLYTAVKIVSNAISDPTAKLAEQLKLDLLTRLEEIATKKLPDYENIIHKGYLVLVLGEIENAKWKSVKMLKPKLKKNSSRIISMSKEIDNIADRVLVECELGIILQRTLNEDSLALVDNSLDEVKHIQNIRDRLERIEEIAKCYGKLKNTNKARELFKLGEELSQSLDVIDRDQILASIIQVASEFDKEFASDLSEKIEDTSTQIKVDLSRKAINLSKSPQKISSLTREEKSIEVLNRAAEKMNQMIAGGKNVAIPKTVLVEWLLAIRNSNYSESEAVIDWVITSWLIQSPSSEIQHVSKGIFSSLTDCAKLLILLGGQLSKLASIPDDLKPSFQGYPVNKKYFEVGDESLAREYIKEWISINVKNDILICDPYFGPEQIWLLQVIPNDAIVRILTTTKGFNEKQRKNEELSNCDAKSLISALRVKCKERMKNAWEGLSKQSPPRTFVVVHNAIFENDDLHDRFILTQNSGISLGTSINGFGKKGFFTTILSAEDVSYIYKNYITPRIHIEDLFFDVIYFDLE